MEHAGSISCYLVKDAPLGRQKDIGRHGEGSIQTCHESFLTIAVVPVGPCKFCRSFVGTPVGKVINIDAHYLHAVTVLFIHLSHFRLGHSARATPEAPKIKQNVSAQHIGNVMDTALCIVEFDIRDLIAHVLYGWRIKIISGTSHLLFEAQATAGKLLGSITEFL